MQKAVPVGEGAMAALLGLELEAAQEACKEAAQGEVVAVANDNARRPGRGERPQGCRRARHRDGQAAGAKRGMLLPVSAPFHCALMQPAADAMAEALATVTIAHAARAAGRQRDWRAEITEPDAIKQLLVEQVTGLVRWRESVQYMKAQGVETLVECGSGKVLTGLVKRIDKEMTGLALEHAGRYRSFSEDAVITACHFAEDS